MSQDANPTGREPAEGHAPGSPWAAAPEQTEDEQGPVRARASVPPARGSASVGPPAQRPVPADENTDPGTGSQERPGPFPPAGPPPGYGAPQQYGAVPGQSGGDPGYAGPSGANPAYGPSGADPAYGPSGADPGNTGPSGTNPAFGERPASASASVPGRTAGTAQVPGSPSGQYPVAPPAQRPVSLGQQGAPQQGVPQQGGQQPPDPYGQPTAAGSFPGFAPPARAGQADPTSYAQQPDYGQPEQHRPDYGQQQAYPGQSGPDYGQPDSDYGQQTQAGQDYGQQQTQAGQEYAQQQPPHHPSQYEPQPPYQAPPEGGGYGPPGGAPAYGTANPQSPFGQPGQPPYGQPSGPSAYGTPSGPPAYGTASGPPAYGTAGAPPAFGDPNAYGQQATNVYGAAPYGGPDQRQYDPATGAADPSGAPPSEADPAKKKKLLLILGVVGVIALLALIGTGVTLALRGTGSSFAVGDCVKQSGTKAVKADCTAGGSYKVVSKVDKQNDCPDAGQQPYVVVTSGQDKQVLCLRPAAQK